MMFRFKILLLINILLSLVVVNGQLENQGISYFGTSRVRDQTVYTQPVPGQQGLLSTFNTKTRLVLPPRTIAPTATEDSKLPTVGKTPIAAGPLIVKASTLRPLALPRPIPSITTSKVPVVNNNLVSSIPPIATVGTVTDYVSTGSVIPSNILSVSSQQFPPSTRKPWLPPLRTRPRLPYEKRREENEPFTSQTPLPIATSTFPYVEPNKKSIPTELEQSTPLPALEEVINPIDKSASESSPKSSSLKSSEQAISSPALKAVVNSMTKSTYDSTPKSSEPVSDRVFIPAINFGRETGTIVKDNIATIPEITSKKPPGPNSLSKQNYLPSRPTEANVVSKSKQGAIPPLLPKRIPDRVPVFGRHPILSTSSPPTTIQYPIDISTKATDFLTSKPSLVTVASELSPVAVTNSNPPTIVTSRATLIGAFTNPPPDTVPDTSPSVIATTVVPPVTLTTKSSSMQVSNEPTPAPSIATTTIPAVIITSKPLPSTVFTESPSDTISRIPPSVHVTTKIPLLISTNSTTSFTVPTETSPVAVSGLNSPVITTTVAPIIKVTGRNPPIRVTTKAPITLSSITPLIIPTTKVPPLKVTTRAPLITLPTKSPPITISSITSSYNGTTKAPSQMAASRAPPTRPSIKPLPVKVTSETPSTIVTNKPLVGVTSSRFPPVIKSTQRPIETTGSLQLNFICKHGNGYYAVPNECDTYIQCEQATAIKYSCPDGLYFNPAAHYYEYPCAYPAEVKCTGVEQVARPTSQCPRQYGIFSMNDGDCSRYIMCQGGVATIMDCPSGLAFNSATNSCDWPANVPQCKPNVFKNFSCPEPPLAISGDISDMIFKYRYGQQCQNYVACQRGYPRLLSCESGLAFDEDSQSCIDANLVMNCAKITPY